MKLSGATPLLLCLALSSLVACSDESVSPVSDDAVAASGAASSVTGAGGGPGAGGAGGDSGGAPPAAVYRATIAGALTWQVTFDEAAQAAGATDCSYTRSYQGVEDRSAPWRCPACEIIFHADVELSAGESDCFPQVSPEPPAPAEWIGYGAGVWYRGPQITTEQGTAAVEAADVAVENVVTDVEALVGGLMGFTVSGTFTVGEEEGDPLHGFVAPAQYACGWPKADPPPYQGDYLLVAGETVPDGLLLDACEEPVRIHDFQGSYLLLKMSARDCVPCQVMAGDEEAWVAELEAQGISAHVLTLLAPSLAEPLGPTTTKMLEAWTNKFDLTAPVLADRALGVALFRPLFPDVLSFPSWVLVDPDLRVMQWGAGFGGFEELTAVVLADTP